MIRMLQASIRVRALVGLCLSAFPLLAALVFQHLDNLDPCHLCIFQRVAYVCSAAVFSSALVFNPHSHWNRCTHGFLAALSSVAGLGLALRQIWLQHLPEDKVPSCGASLEFMMEVLPLREVVERVLKGTGECAVVDWTLMGLSMAQWSAICLCAILACAFWLMLPRVVFRN